MRLLAHYRRILVVAGMVENMAGMVTGDTREFVVIIPETWETESLRGVPARCTVTVNEVFEWELPEVGNSRLINPRVANALTQILRTNRPKDVILNPETFYNMVFYSKQWPQISRYSSLSEGVGEVSGTCRLEKADSGIYVTPHEFVKHVTA